MTAISLVGKDRITELDGRTHERFVSDGFAQVQHDVLTVWYEAGEFAHGIDMERVKPTWRCAARRTTRAHRAFDCPRAPRPDPRAAACTRIGTSRALLALLRAGEIGTDPLLRRGLDELSCTSQRACRVIRSAV